MTRTSDWISSIIIHTIIEDDYGNENLCEGRSWIDSENTQMIEGGLFNVDPEDWVGWDKHIFRAGSEPGDIEDNPLPATPRTDESGFDQFQVVARLRQRMNLITYLSNSQPTNQTNPTNNIQKLKKTTIIDNKNPVGTLHHIRNRKNSRGE
ncbi:hypothetical protein BY996DRAFT_6559348 [Phakopsora pachyrhizi]|nr:hypothetical protein BY996DRAFT_6559348 [Phakopsora pachyrhizi]